MKFYFIRFTEIRSRIKLYSYTFFVLGIASIIFYPINDASKSTALARILMCISFCACSVLSLFEVIKEIKSQGRCNVYDLARGIVCGVLCIVSLTCIDSLLR